MEKSILNRTLERIPRIYIHEINIYASYWNMISIAKGIKESLKDCPRSFKLSIKDYSYNVEVKFMWLAWDCNETCNEKHESIYLYFNDKEETLWDSDKKGPITSAVDNQIQKYINKTVKDYLNDIKSDIDLSKNNWETKIQKKYLSGHLGNNVDKILKSK